MNDKLYLGKQPCQSAPTPVQGRQIVLDGEEYYAIANYDRMRPFFMTLVSASDHWLFISSTGALTAGRGNPDLALFPYATDDKIHDSADITGSKTLIRVEQQGRQWLWEPLSDRCRGVYRVERRLYKSFTGNKLRFEEHNADLGLTFSYEWSNSQRFGFVRRAWVKNRRPGAVRLVLLDGLQNLMPCGAGSRFHLEYSTLLDAYKKNELVPATGLGLYTLSAVPIDRPEPAEALRATTVWQAGIKPRAILLSSVQVGRFRNGLPLVQETDVRAERGAYLINADLKLKPGQTTEWWIVADVNRGPAEVVDLNRLLRTPARLRRQVEADVKLGTEELRRIVGAADGLQTTAEPLRNARHFANVLFNVMRGGIFLGGYAVEPADIRAFVTHANRAVAARHAPFFRQLKPGGTCAQMVALAAASGDPQLERICREYLPLTFSRRHGDPSRPWNRFSIATCDAGGKRILNYEGNWRDLFQNWEALAVSFPGFTAAMICKFVNASTADGYNPYRVTRDGIDWEVVDPHDAWSFIGYWGDHQVIYLLKLLEILQRHEPAALRELLTREIFSYANVPYRIKPYEALLRDPKDTVVFDRRGEDLVQERIKAAGADGKLVWDNRGEVRLVNLTEKLVVPLLAKLSNFIPGAGIWLNTQRPEWNDANNALVGNGVSMVTLCYLRRHLAFLTDVFQPLAGGKTVVSQEVNQFLTAVTGVLEQHSRLLQGQITDRQRKSVLDALGRAGSAYRERLYHHGFSGRKDAIPVTTLLGFFSRSLKWIDHTIAANRRHDAMYEAYNLVSFGGKAQVGIRRLYLMLEGQVAALSSGLLSPAQSLELLKALRHSYLFRSDQHSYVLYPDRPLPRFLEKNNLPRRALAKSALLSQLVADGNRLLVERDSAGGLHFNGSIRNAGDVRQRLGQLAAAGYGPLVRRDTPLLLHAFEQVFNHQAFTGRSGTFFGYEGLGCIYWHMVSKLLLAAQEAFFRAADSGAPAAILRQLADCYYDIRAGIGDAKTADVYGAFPMDPYSHTPGHAGARQPGLTGQVKEDILCRWGELGVSVRSAQLCFRPLLLRREEFLTAPAVFPYWNVAGQPRRLRLKAGSLAFACCQTPVIYQLGPRESVTVWHADGTSREHPGLSLDAETSRQVFERTGQVDRIVLTLRLGQAWASGWPQ
ncbi:MAG TPA: hypothetical protein VMU04_13480 [Candidatus Acidoferrum sp.]|nr:hypothetical protein [Candidatus Acidoferrum sp.]